MRAKAALAALPLLFCLSACLSAPDREALAADYLFLADSYAEVEEYEKALFFYERAATEPAFRDVAEYGMGRMYALSENWRAAARVFRRLYEKDPENGILLSSYAFALASDGQIERALPLYAGLRDSRPDDARLAADYAELLFAAGLYDEALEEAAAVKERFPDNEQTVSLDDMEERVAKALAGPEGDAEGESGSEAPAAQEGQGEGDGNEAPAADSGAGE